MANRINAAATPSTTSFLRPDLEMSFEEFDLMASMGGFVGGEIFPFFDTRLQRANFTKVPVESLLRNVNTRRSSRGHYSQDDQDLEQDNYSCEEHGHEQLVDDRDRAIYAYAVEAERLAAERALAVVMRDHERQIADAAFDTAVFTGALTGAGTAAWSNKTSATPIKDIHDALIAVRNNCGMMANAIVMSWELFIELQTIDEITDRLKHWGGDDPKQHTPQALASLFNVDRIIIGGAVKNTAGKSLDASISGIYPNDKILIAKLCTSGDLREPCLGRTFHFVEDGSSQGVTVEQYRDEARRADIIRARMDYDVKTIHSVCGYLMTGL